MSENYYGFEKFCSLLDDNNILKKATAIGVMVHLQKCIEEIKSLVLKDLIQIDEKKKDHYLDLKINEIKRQDYLKDYEKEKIERWLEEFNVHLYDIINGQVNSDYFYKMVDGYYEQNFEPGTKEYNTSRAAQNDFLLFFLNYYANELISFLESNKTTFEGKIIKPEFYNIEPTASQKIVNEISGAVETIVDYNKELKDKFDFDAYLSNSISQQQNDRSEYLHGQIKMLEDYINRNLDKLYSVSKVDNFYYFDCPSAVYINCFKSRRIEYFGSAPDALELEFLLFEVEYLSQPFNNRIIGNKSKYNYDKLIPYNERYKSSIKRKIEFLSNKLKPFNYSISYKENVLLSDVFDKEQSWGTEIHAIKTMNSTTVQLKDETLEVDSKTVKQLTINQIVVLLQETGFFAHPKIENAPKTKQSELISKICGLNAKNIKSKIENLDKNHKELGEYHQKDIDKIDNILNNLE